MPPNNRLAPPLRNSLASYVPAPLDPNMMPPEVSPRFGVGEGLTSRLKSAKQTLQDPVQAVKETAMAIRQMYDDPMLALQALRQLRQQIMSGPIGMGQAIGEMAPVGVRGAPVMQELDVYHGTPHRFPATEANPLGEFDASKIGTGEGAQVYGRGIYFTESPQAATQYKERLSSSKPSQASFIRMRDQEQVGSEVWNYYNELARQRESSLYKADLPDEMIDRMLDYDKPINEQNQFVLDALEKAGINTQSAMRAGQMIQGQEAHLAKFGIPGITYREQGGPRNFVVFPGEEKKVRILERK